MQKNKKIFMWVLIAVVAILIIYIVVTAKKQVGGLPTSKENQNTGTQGVPSESDADQAGVDTTVPPTTVSAGKFGLGDKIYAGEDILNSYSSCSPSQSTLVKTFSKGDLIGTYVRNEGNCIVVSVNTYYNFWLGKNFSVPTGSTNNFLLYNANIYVK